MRRLRPQGAAVGVRPRFYWLNSKAMLYICTCAVYALNYRLCKSLLPVGRFDSTLLKTRLNSYLYSPLCKNK